MSVQESLHALTTASMCFFVSNLSIHNGHFYFDILQDDRRLISGYTGSGHGYKSSSQMAIVKCLPNSKVWVVRENGNYGGSVIWKKWNSFAGFKIAKGRTI